MNLESQVVSLELSKRLKELGIMQASLLYWVKVPYSVRFKQNPDGTIYENENGETEVDTTEYRYELSNPYSLHITQNDSWAAFTVAELLEILPAMVYGSCLQLLRGLNFGDVKPMYCCRYDMFFSDNSPFADENPANACAKLLIELIEQGIYKP